MAETERGQEGEETGREEGDEQGERARTKEEIGIGRERQGTKRTTRTDPRIHASCAAALSFLVILRRGFEFCCDLFELSCDIHASCAAARSAGRRPAWWGQYMMYCVHGRQGGGVRVRAWGAGR